MIATDSTGAAGPTTYFENREKQLRCREDELLGRLHELTRRRDAGGITLQASLPLELSLVIELGQVHDRLRLMGCHAYDGCRECRPLSWSP